MVRRVDIGVETWLPPGARTLLDVGCNAGALLALVRASHPDLALAGVDIDRVALHEARVHVPQADIRAALATDLPFADDSFDVVTCMDVLEHVPEPQRAPALSEMRRVVRTGGHLVIQVPHAGAFSALDPQNFRHRAPRLYGRLVSSGVRDERYADAQQDVVWHHHFTRDELVGLLGPGWRTMREHYGGCLIQPLTEILRWPYFRRGSTDSRGYRFLTALSVADHGRDWGRLAYEVLLVLAKDPAGDAQLSTVPTAGLA
jgi:SAM-dependent methyltransferase